MPLQHRVETLNQQLPALLITAQRIGHDVLGKQFELGARFAGFGRRDLLQFGFDAFAQPIRWTACGVARLAGLEARCCADDVAFTKGMVCLLVPCSGLFLGRKRGRNWAAGFMSERATADSIPAASTTFVSRGTRQDGIQENPGWEEGIKVSQPRGWFYPQTRPSPNFRAAPSRCHTHRAICSTYSREGPRRNLWLAAPLRSRETSLGSAKPLKAKATRTSQDPRFGSRQERTSRFWLRRSTNVIRPKESADREKDRDALPRLRRP